MGQVLHSGASVMCMHGGTASATVTSPRVKLGGQPAAAQGAPWTVAGCPFMTGTNPMPCVTAQWVTAALRVKAGGMPLLLSDSQAVCVPNGTGVNVVYAQLRVKAQ
ncbi:MAG TPA: hypothetical protein VNP72_03105 [Longimicrobium sp.]|nr:hypothetical protein [Longimicrobium sp.]